MSAAHFAVRVAHSERDVAAIADIRRIVFVDELGIPPAAERDGRDASSIQALAVDAHERPVGCARLLPDGCIGRIAVIREWRGRGVGGALVETLVALARERGHDRVALNAQADACAFYERHGFERIGAPWTVAGLAHVAMERRF